MTGPVDLSLLGAIPGSRKEIVRLAAVGVGAGIVALAQALSVAWVVAAVVEGEPLGPPLVSLGITLVVRGLLAGLAEIVDRRAGHAVSGELRLRLLQAWLRRPAEERPSHDAAVRLAGVGVGSVEPYVARYLPALVTAIVVPVLAVVAMLAVDVWSGLILIVTLPLLPLFAALIGKHTADESDRRWSAMELMAGHFLDVVRGLPTLVAYGRAEHQIEVVRSVGDRHRRASVEALRTAFLSSAALELLATISVAMVAVAVGLRLAHGSIALQVGLSAILLAPEAYWPIRRVGQEFHNAADGAGVLDQVRSELLVDGEPLAQNHDRVEVRGVSFGYPDRELILDGVSVSTPHGPGLTALTGESGSGKSTLLDLIAGIRRAHAGTIQAPVGHLGTQRPLLLVGSVAEALRLSQPAASDEACRSVLQGVGLWSALEGREGLETRIGDDGVGLSAGQRTRLALARAMLSDAPLVMLDEPTAHVDRDDLDGLRDLIVELAASRRVIAATHDGALVLRADSHWELEAAQELGETIDLEKAEAGSDEAAMATLDRWQQRSVGDRLRMASFLGGMSMAAGVALTATSGWLIVQASTRPIILTLLVAIVGVRAFGIARPLLRYAERIVSHDAALETLTDRRVDVFRSLIPLTPARLGRRNRGDLLSAVVTDLDDAVDQQVRVHVPWWSTVLATAVAVAIVVMVLPAAALVLALVAVVVFVGAELGSRAEAGAQAEAVRRRAEVLRVTNDLVDQIDQVRAVTGANPDGAAPLLALIEDSHEAQAGAEQRLIRSRAVTLVAIWVSLAVGATVVALVARWGLDSGRVSGPLAALVALAPIALADAWVGLAEVGGARARAEQAEERLAEVLGQEPAVADEGTLEVPGGLPMVAEDISAAWVAGQEPLGPFTLPPLEPGVRAQVTGPNGFGKSTLLAVLARHLDPLSGRHMIASHPAGDVSLESARADIAIVSDEPHAFGGSIRANLALAAPKASDEQMVAALMDADLARWLGRQPRGLGTSLDGLSGGERARLAIARALLSERRLVLLDEPTAHLDEATAQRCLASLVADQGRAIVAVSHQPLDLGTMSTPPTDQDGGSQS